MARSLSETSDNSPVESSTSDQATIKAQICGILAPFLQFYDRQIDLRGLVGDMPIKDGEAESEYFNRVLDRLGYAAQTHNVADVDLSTVDRPHFVPLGGDQGYALVMPAKSYGRDHFVIHPSKAVQTQLQDTPYSGDLIAIDEQTESLGDYMAHMKTGHSLDWFWQPLVRYRDQYYEIITASVFINLLVLALPLFSLNIYDRVAVNLVEETLYVLTIGIALALVFDFVFKNIRTYILERLAEKLGKEFDYKLMERLMNIRSADATTSVGEQANMFRELQSIREFYASKLVPTLVDLPFIILFILIIAGIGGVVAWVPTATIAIIIIVNLSAHFPISRVMEQYFAAIQKKSGYLIETLNGMPALRMFNAHSNRLFHWDQIDANAARVTRHNSILLAALSNFTFLMSQLCHILIIFFGIFLIHKGELTVGGLITCTIISGRAIAPAMNLSSLISRMKQSEDVLKAIDKFFQLPHFDEDSLTKAPKGPFQGHIDIRDISYTYPGQSRPAISNVKLSIPPGTHIGIIGQSAAGKSTLAKCVSDILSPQDGDIAIDGIRLIDIPHTELCRTIAYAPQESHFFRGTVMHNITLGRSDISPEALERAIFVSGLDMVLRANGQGMDTEVGENGCNLSGGQQQALSLARALARDPKILIFDEPTTGMDTMLEAHVQKELKAFIKDRTFIMITHRTSLLSLVDRLALLERGQLALDGTRDVVLNKLAGKG